MFNKLFLLLPILIIFGCEDGGGTTNATTITATQQQPIDQGQDTAPVVQEPNAQEPNVQEPDAQEEPIADGNEQDDATQEEDTPPQVPANTSTQNAIVDRHNQIRAEVYRLRDEVYSDATISWDDTVGDSAQDYANELAANGKFEHEAGIGYGENLFASSYAADYSDAIDAWYGEKAYYHYDTNDCDDGQTCGHYTQMIWRDSTSVGCGKATFTTGQYNGWTVIVCRYNPPGNFVGEKPY